MTDKDKETGGPGEVTEDDRAAAGKPEEAEWTIMIYQAGDNDLAEDSVRALTEVRDVKTGDLLHVIAQFDPNNPRMETRRLVLNVKDKKNRKVAVAAGAAIAPHGDRGQLAQDSVGLQLGRVPFPGGRRVGRQGRPAAAGRETDTSDPETLFDFISWSTQEFPAKRYMLVLSGHSAGVQSGFLLKDLNPPRSMSFNDLMRVLDAVRDKLQVNLNVLGMDACLMNMVEICYELKRRAEIIVGAQGLVPGPGWPYKQIVAGLMERLEAGEGKIEAEDVGPMIVRRYINSYLEQGVIGGLSVDLGALRVGESENVTAQVKALTEVLEGELGKPDTNVWKALVLAHWQAQSYNGELFVDLHDFCDLLVEHYPQGDVPEACRRVQEAIGRMVIQSCFCGIDYQYSFGLSIYFPWSSIFSGYTDLAFPEVSGWGRFLETYLDATRRRPRGGGGGFKMALAFRSDHPWTRTRKVPPYHGPGESAHSMRNPPDEYPQATECIRDEEDFKVLMTQFTVQ